MGCRFLGRSPPTFSHMARLCLCSCQEGVWQGDDESSESRLPTGNGGGRGAVVKGWYERVSEELAAGLGASWQEHARTSEGPRGREA